MTPIRASRRALRPRFSSPTALALAAATAALALAACKGNDGGGTTEPPPDPSIDDGLCSPLPPPPRRIWRLSVQQYSNSVRDLLGTPAGPTIASTGGTSVYAFFSDDAATVDETLSYQINLALRQLLGEQASRLRPLAACNTGEAEDACAARFAQRFGTRAFRRALDADEVTRLMGVYAEGRKQDFETGISLMVQALLQSPSFMFRSELGGAADGNNIATLTPFEVATQLSYTFLDSAPDQTLIDAATNGSLGTSDGIATQVDRLLALPAVHENISRVVIDWFNVQQVSAKTKDPSLLTALGADAANQGQLQTDLYHSAKSFVDEVLWTGDGHITDLVTSPRLFVNTRLATLYGLQAAGATADTFVGVDVPGRAGMITQPAVLWAASDPAVTSIVHRGIFLHNDVICADPLPPPGGILDDPAVQAKLATLPTEIDKSDYRLNTAQCSQCHGQIDNYGRIPEGFDSVGRTRTQADGLPVQNTGDFSMSAPLKGTITGPEAFAQAIVTSKQALHCATQKMASYTLGRMIRVNATCELRDVRKAVETSDGTITTLFRNIATAPFARARAGGAQ